MREQNSILFQYFWRSLHAAGKLNDYHYLVFNKVKFKNDLNNLNKLISSSDYDIYLTHFLFPHRPFGFDIRNNNKNCNFNKRNVEIQGPLHTKKEILNKHYQEIICTNIYLDKFLNEIEQKPHLNKIEIFIISDTGLKIENGEDSQYDLKNTHSVFFAIYGENKKFKVYNEFISSQELFSKYFNPLYQKSYSQNENKIFLTPEKAFKKIDRF
jgi:hypothetical protein